MRETQSAIGEGVLLGVEKCHAGCTRDRATQSTRHTPQSLLQAVSVTQAVPVTRTVTVQLSAAAGPNRGVEGVYRGYGASHSRLGSSTDVELRTGQ